MPDNNGSAPNYRLRVGYILKMFPRLSETFILNELLELEKQGVEVSVFSLMYPADGRFHGRLVDLKLIARYFSRDKPEGYWKMIWELPKELVPPLSRWQEAVDFLHRWNIPKDMDMLLRAVLMSAEARARGLQHLHAHFATIATRMAALVNILTGIPFSFTSHAKDIFRTTVDRGLYAELVERSTFNITVSDFNREFILSHTPGVDADKIIRLYNGIDLSFFAPEPVKHSSHPLHIFSVGRLVPKKGFDHLLRALHILKQKGKPFRATIAGEGGEEARLLALRKELGLTNDVTFTGSLPTEQVAKLCATASMVVLACVADVDGNQDALPTVLLEALAYDLPVVSTHLSGIPEIVGEEAGILVTPGNDEELTEAIIELEQRMRNGKIPPGAARSRAERLFDLRKNAAELHKLFARSARAGAGG
ncbi:MAG: glycosyltransferase family 4 protein [Planctomycetota bacterium]